MIFDLSPGRSLVEAGDHHREFAGLERLRQLIAHAAVVRQQFEALLHELRGAERRADAAANRQRVAEFVAADERADRALERPVGRPRPDGSAEHRAHAPRVVGIGLNVRRAGRELDVAAGAAAADGSRIEHDRGSAADLELVRRRDIGELAGGLCRDEGERIGRLRAAAGRDDRWSVRFQRGAIRVGLRAGRGGGVGRDRRALRLGAADRQGKNTDAHHQARQRQQVRQVGNELYAHWVTSSFLGVEQERTTESAVGGTKRKAADHGVYRLFGRSLRKYYCGNAGRGPGPA